MSEKRKLLIALGFVLLFVALIGLAAYTSHLNNLKTKEKFDTLFNGKTNEIIYIGRPTCSYCSKFKPILDDISKNFNVKYNYFNTDEISNSQLDYILEKLDIDPNEFGTPYLAIVANGKKVAEKPGYVDEKNLFEFLKENDLISKDAKLALNYIDYKAYTKLLESEEQSIIMVGQTGCEACISADPVIKEIIKEYDLEINYLNLTNLSSEEEGQKFMNSLPEFKQGLSTPTIIIIKNGKVVDMEKGFVNKDTYLKFFKKNKYID